MGEIYEMTVAREHIMEKIQVDNVDIARDIFKEKSANKENCIRARVVKDGKVTVEKFYGEDPDWWVMDDEWNNTEKEINSSMETWDIYIVDIATGTKTVIDSCKTENDAINWIIFHHNTDAKFNQYYIYMYEHVYC